MTAMWSSSTAVVTVSLLASAAFGSNRTARPLASVCSATSSSGSDFADAAVSRRIRCVIAHAALSLPRPSACTAACRLCVCSRLVADPTAAVGTALHDADPVGVSEVVAVVEPDADD